MLTKDRSTACLYDQNLGRRLFVVLQNPAKLFIVVSVIVSDDGQGTLILRENLNYDDDRIVILQEILYQNKFLM